MSEASGATPEPTLVPPGASGTDGALRVFLRAVLYLGITLAIGIVAYVMFRATQEQASSKDSVDRLIATRGLIQPVRKRLAPDYSDKNGRLLADPPSQQSQQLDPDALVMAHYIDADTDAQLVDWDDLQSQLAKATGKHVVSQEYRNIADDIAATKAGNIQIVALHAADTPYLVNNVGFIPVAVLGSEVGTNGNRLNIAVSAKSKIQKLADLRGHKLTCTVPESMTGYRAAIVLLMQEVGMRPDVDYSIGFSMGQKRSVLGLIGGEFEVAALSDDKLKSMLKDGSIKPSDYRVIYTSEVIPRLTIGYVYNLRSDLAAKVTSAVLDFRNERGVADETTGQPMRFFAIDYKKDFEFVRRIDDSFDPRIRKTPKEPPAETASGPTY